VHAWAEGWRNHEAARLRGAAWVNRTATNAAGTGRPTQLLLFDGPVRCGSRCQDPWRSTTTGRSPDSHRSQRRAEQDAELLPPWSENGLADTVPEHVAGVPRSHSSWAAAKEETVYAVLDHTSTGDDPGRRRVSATSWCCALALGPTVCSPHRRARRGRATPGGSGAGGALAASSTRTTGCRRRRRPGPSASRSAPRRRSDPDRRRDLLLVIQKQAATSTRRTQTRTAMA